MTVVKFPRCYRHPLPEDAIPRGRDRHATVCPLDGKWALIEQAAAWSTRCAWQATTGKIATWLGHARMLGEDNLLSPRLDDVLMVHAASRIVQGQSERQAVKKVGNSRKKVERRLAR